MLWDTCLCTIIDWTEGFPSRKFDGKSTLQYLRKWQRLVFDQSQTTSCPEHEMQLSQNMSMTRFHSDLFNYQTYVTLSMFIEWKKSSPNHRTSLIGFVRYPKKENGTSFRRCVRLITDMTNALCFVGLKPAIRLNYPLIRLWTIFYDVKRRFPHDKRPEYRRDELWNTRIP